MPIRFLADADFNQIIVSAVVRRHQEIEYGRHFHFCERDSLDTYLDAE